MPGSHGDEHHDAEKEGWHFHSNVVAKQTIILLSCSIRLERRQRVELGPTTTAAGNRPSRFQRQMLSFETL
ncbi:hypothetical protein IE00_10050 [Paracoccus sp. SM22M-07]|nr:hypothetical protein IE00_10050 [Paracoccus sp. SM22M-07]